MSYTFLENLDLLQSKYLIILPLPRLRFKVKTKNTRCMVLSTLGPNLAKVLLYSEMPKKGT